MLQVQNLTAGYGSLTVLNGVSLSLGNGARLGVFGHNGAGKTTLLRCIVGAVRPRDGKVDLDGTDTGVATVAENVRRGIAFGAARSQRIPKSDDRAEPAHCRVVVRPKFRHSGIRIIPGAGRAVLGSVQVR